MRFRQVHLDFHTSEAIKNIGKSFSKKQFQSMLKEGCVDSITVFAKCHHGWAYFPSKENDIHPELSFDLLGAMIEAAHEIDVKTPVYISAGLDEKLARKHPEWLIRDKEDNTNWVKDFMTPGYHQFCMNSPYLDILLNQIREVVTLYDADGIFLDIVGERVCYCHNCLADMLDQGLNPKIVDDVVNFGKKVYKNYVEQVRETIHSIKPDMNIFHNSGHIERGRRDLIHVNTHLELESLPTGGWGYDHFPLSVRYVQNLGIDYLGMTGKFHTAWGEFGGYKHPNALIYETALCLANGARCSIGDQLHPEGVMDQATYQLIGKAYRQVQSKEKWCVNTNNIADVALLSLEAVKASFDDLDQKTFSDRSDNGAVRMLLEGNILFDVIDLEEDFNKYKVIILPDQVKINSILEEKLNDFFANGGKVLATGESGLNKLGNGFSIDLGVKWLGENQYNPDYFRPKFELQQLDDASFVFYSIGQKIELNGGRELGVRENPYFNRDTFTFCSHLHTPSSLEYGGPGMVESENGIYFAWRVFEDYSTKGSLILRESVLYALNKLLPNKTLETNLPSQGITTLQNQKIEKRLIHHLIYASPVKRGENIEVIEDLIPIYNINVTLRIPYKVNRIYLAPEMTDIPFQQSGQQITYTVPKVDCHQMIVIDY